jgi:hypothetical protein
MNLSDVADDMVKGLNARVRAVAIFGGKAYPCSVPVIHYTDTIPVPCYAVPWTGMACAVDFQFQVIA